MAAPRVHTDEVAVVMRDGTALATDVFGVGDGPPRPVMLIRTPYSRAAARAAHDPIALVRDGWAVVIQDVRGRWHSPGEFDPFRQEVDDGADTVAWCAAQPWSTGAVVMTGASYDGITQWLAGFAGPPHLRAISPTVTSPYVRESWIRPGGALNLGFLANWGIGLGMIGTGPGEAINEAALARLDQWEATVRSPRATGLITEAFPRFATWLTEPGSDYWTALDPGRLTTLATVPGYHLTGWFDIFCEGALAAYAALTRAGGAPQRLVVGPWTHGQVFGTTAGERDFGMAASGFARFPAERLRFLKEAACGTPPTGGASVFLMGRNVWLDLPAWPPPATETAFYLTHHDAAGYLSPRPPARAGVDRWRHDPARPVPTRGGRTLHPGLRLAGPVAQEPPGRPGVVSYLSEPLDRELAIIGPVRASLLVESTAEVMDLAAKLIDVHPDGRSFNLVDSLTRTRPGAAGSATWHTVTLGATAHWLPPGHRLRLDVAASNFPAADTAPAATQTLHHGPGAPSRLILPVVDPTLLDGAR